MFFQKFWHIVESEVTDICLTALNGNMNIKEINLTNIVLLPKIPHPTNLINFKPINLCSVVYKLIVKVLVNCMKEFMDVCIDH